MHSRLLDILRCPRTGQHLELESAVYEGARVRSGELVTPDRAQRYPIRDFIPRFVPASNYADNFGLQWNMFRETQLDSTSGHPISATRFWTSTGWSPQELAGKLVLDCGCGAGRFAEVALGAGAHVVALDYSNAVDAAYQNLKRFPNLDLVQGDIYALPFAPGRFHYVYSLGVLQHTPDVRAAFAALPPMLRPGGKFCADFYELTWKHRLLPYRSMRVVTTRMDRRRLFKLCERYVPRLLSVSQFIGRIPIIGKVLKRVVPVADYTGLLPLDQRQLREWALLDTYDWLAPAYDQPQRRNDVREWISSAGFEGSAVFKAGHMVVRASGKK